MLGAHQAHNTALAVTAVERLRRRGWRVSDEAVEAGLRSVRWPARIEVVAEQPTVVLDAAHNWASVTALLKTLDENFRPRSRILVFAATKDKDVLGMLRQLLPRFDTVILTCYLNNPRVVPLEQLAGMARSISSAPFHLAADTAAAWQLARRCAGPEDLICVTGSFFIAAEMRDLILEKPG
jgi:dihydrofolate synthase/folylpolyglutamate synthase